VTASHLPVCGLRFAPPHSRWTTACTRRAWSGGGCVSCVVYIKEMNVWLCMPIGLMDGPVSQRSITYAGIADIVKLMAPGDDDAPFTSHEMQKIFQGELPLNGVSKPFHPMQRFEGHYCMRPPDFAVTYVWGMDFRKQLPRYMDSVKKYVQSPGFVHDVEGIKFEDMTFWVDVFFVDQNNSNLTVRLVEDCSHIYSRSLHHVIFMSDTILERGWCLVEICYRTFAVQKEYTLKTGDLINLLAGRPNIIPVVYSSTVSLRQGVSEKFISVNKLPSLHFIGGMQASLERYCRVSKQIVRDMRVYEDIERVRIREIINTLFPGDDTFDRVVHAFARGALLQLRKAHGS